MPWIEKEGRTVEEATEAAVAEASQPREELEIEVVREGAKGLFGLGGEPALVRVRPRSEARDVRSAFQTPPRAPVAVEPDGEDREDVAVADVQDRAGPAIDTRTAPESESAVADDGEGTESEDKQTLSERQDAAASVASDMVRGILERMQLEGDVNTRVNGGTVYVEVFGDNMGILIGRGGATLEALQELVRAGVQRKLKARQAVVVDVEAYWERRRGRRRRNGGSRGGNRSDD